MQDLRHFYSARHQKGVSLFIVIVLVMLSMLLALWGSRTSLFNEMIVGNDADYQRAFEAAQALIQDAEFDIRGERPDGSPCVPDGSKVDLCRTDNAGIWFPLEDQDLPDFFAKLQLATATQFCSKGVCLKRTGNQNFWDDKATLDTMITVGARYGHFTGAETGSASSSILNDGTAGRGGWYWIEVMPYDSNAGNSGLISDGSQNLALNLKPNIAFRITAVARGIKPNTQVVLQSTYVRQKLKD